MINISIGDTGNQDKKVREKGSNLIDFPDSCVVVDTETTGLDPYYDSLIELVGIKYENDIEVDRFQELINPQYSISSFITNLTGITNEMLEGAREESEVLKDFYAFVGNSVVVAHNAHFDINFIYDSLLKHQDIKFSNDFVDTLRLARRLLPELNHHRLKDLAKYYGYDYLGAHRAEFDAELTTKILSHLKEQSIEKYGSIEVFKERQSKTSSPVKAKDISSDKSKHDPDNLLYEKVCVITGKLEYFTRKEVMKVIADIGGINGDNVTKKTDYLILGNFDYNVNIKGNMSSKLKKAEKYILEGQDLEILSENVFYDLIKELEWLEELIGKGFTILTTNLTFNRLQECFNDLTLLDVKVTEWRKRAY